MILKMLKKDLKVLFSDKKRLLMFILMPIVLTTILSFSLTGNFRESGKFNPINVAVVKSYDSEKEIKYFKEKISEFVDTEDIDFNLNPEEILFKDFLENKDIKEIINPKIMSKTEAETAILKDEIVAIVYLPKNFIYNQLINFTAGFRNKIEIEILTNPDYSYSSQIVEMIFSAYFNQVNQKIIEKNVFIEIAGSYMENKELFDQLPEIMELSKEERKNGNQIQRLERLEIEGERSINSRTYYSIAMMSMFILYSAGFTGRELLREKKLLTLSRGTVAGISYWQVLVSKFLMTLYLATVQMSILLVYSTLVLKVSWNKPLYMIIGIIFSAIAVSGIGVFLSAITLTQDNYKVTNIFENVLIHIFALFGGSYIPVDALPDVLAKLKNLAPNGVVLDLFLGIYKGSSLSSMYSYLGILLGISLIFSIFALVIVKAKEVSNYA